MTGANPSGGKNLSTARLVIHWPMKPASAGTKRVPEPPVVQKAAMQSGELRGRRRHMGLRVKQGRSWLTSFSNFYILIMKAPFMQFTGAMIAIPILLSLLFVPLYLLDPSGLNIEPDLLLGSYGEACFVAKQEGTTLPTCQPREAYSVLYIILYALSLSTLFGGCPVQAISSYALGVANFQTLVAQFTFVFLSGAVFSRMSQRDQSIRCSKKAVLRVDDKPVDGDHHQELYRVLCTRLAIKGEPDELLDVRIKLDYRIYKKQKNGTMFCETGGLDLASSEVSLLRHGLMVKHIIDRLSPLYGCTQEWLLKGDISFVLTIAGTECASLHSVFHKQEYFVSDGDVVWNGDFEELETVTPSGMRIVDHCQLDAVKSFRLMASEDSTEEKVELMLGDTFPDFVADSTMGKIQWHEYIDGAWAILFSHPSDYTPVCTTELGSVARLLPEFNKRKVKVAAISHNDLESHSGWVNDIEAFTAGAQVLYPIIADPEKDLGIALGSMDASVKDERGLPINARAVWIIGPDKKLKLHILYPATTGRDFKEVLRVIDSLQLTSDFEVSTPVDWKYGEDVIIVPSVSNEAATEKFPKGFMTAKVPSQKEYLRTTPQPNM